MLRSPSNSSARPLTNGIKIPAGQGYAGLATLIAGTIVVNTSRVTASSLIQMTVNGGTQTNLGFPYEPTGTRVPNTSFTIRSSNALDTSAVAWLLVEPV